MLDTICLVASPRTGANHLMSVLGNFAELCAFPDLYVSLGERLEPQPVFERAAAEATARSKRVMAFKLWPDSLPIETVEATILSRSGVRLVLVMRRQIDAYVSWCKAIMLGQWQGIDTSDERLTLDPADFAAWLDTQERWYDHWQNYLNKRFLPCPVLRYEAHIDQPPERVLKRFAAAAAQVGITLRVPTEIVSTGLERQDRIKAVAEKVSNWPEFSRAIIAKGLEKRAFGYPL